MKSDGLVFYTTENGEIACFYPNEKNTYHASLVEPQTQVKIEPSRTAEFQNIEMYFTSSNVEYNAPKTLDKKLSEDEIITKVGGGDLTKGSCASVAFAYIANKYSNLDVCDFRGGKSCASMARQCNQILKLKDIASDMEEDENDIKAVVRLLKKAEMNKEYYLLTGEHAAIVKRTETGTLFLELQNPDSKGGNGWERLTKERLIKRFGATRTHSIQKNKVKARSYMAEAEKIGKSKDFQYIMGYINTNPSEQRKGEKGHVK